MTSPRNPSHPTPDPVPPAGPGPAAVPHLFMAVGRGGLLRLLADRAADRWEVVLDPAGADPSLGPALDALLRDNGFTPTPDRPPTWVWASRPTPSDPNGVTAQWAFLAACRTHHAVEKPVWTALAHLPWPPGCWPDRRMADPL